MMHPFLAASLATTFERDRAVAARRVAAARKGRGGAAVAAAAAPDDLGGGAAFAPDDLGAAADVVIRRATAADAGALATLGALDGDRRAGELLAAFAGEHAVLVAEVDGELGAALALDGGLAIADPFRPTALHAELLRLRARQLGGAAPRRARGPLGVLHPRTS
jgi:hypothetical protein